MLIIYDFGLADVGYNIIAVTNMSLLICLGIMRITKNKVTDIFVLTFAYLFFEIASYKIDLFGVFDIKDCIA